MNTLVLIGLALVVAGCILLVVRFAPRVRRQFAATGAQPRTVADLVRLREQSGSTALQAAPRVAVPPEPRIARAVVPVAAPSTETPPPPPPAPEPPAPAFVAPSPRPTPVAGRVRRESADPPSPRLDGDNAPWQRGARMAVGLGGGQAWREPPAPPAPLRVVPAAEPAAVEAAEPAPVVPAEPEAPAPAEPESHTDVPQEPEAPAAEVQPQAVWTEPEAPVEEVAASPEPVAAEPVAQPQPAVWTEPEAVASSEPAPAEPVAQPQAVWIAPEAVAEAAGSAEPDEEIPSEGDDPEAEDASEEPRRSRQTPDEKAAEQAAADLALLRTFGFADPAARPDSTPVVAMEHPEEPEAPVEAGAAQPVQYRVIRRDGTVVGGATVTLLDDRGGDVAAGAADAEGRGEVLAPAPGGYVLVSTAAGHQPGAVAITVAGPATETDVLIARSASVSGSAHGANGPIADARVTLVQDGEAVDAVDTDAEGTYRIGDIGAGEYGLSVTAPGYEPVAALLEVAEEADVRHDVALEPVRVAGGGPAQDDAMSELASDSTSQRLRDAVR